MDQDQTVTSDLVTSSEVTTPEDDVMSFHITAVYIPPLVLLVIFTFLANLVVILCVHVDRKLRKPTNLYVVSLAVADALVGLGVMNGMLVYTVYGLWPLSDALCTFWIVTDFSCCTISMIHLCLIAYDRHQALVRPHVYKSPNRSRQILGGIALAWILGILVWLPAIIVFRLEQEPVPYDCFFIPVKEYVVVQSLVVYFMPILVMVYFYVRCLHGLQVQYKKIQNVDGVIHAIDNDGTTIGTTAISTISKGNLSVPVESNSVGEPSGVTPLGDVSTAMDTGSNTTGRGQVVIQKRKRRRQEHIRSIRTLGVIILIFLFCWLPFCLFWPIAAYCPDCIPLKWYEYSYWSAYLNSTVNPLLYFLCNKDFRSAFLKLKRTVTK